MDVRHLKIIAPLAALAAFGAILFGLVLRSPESGTELAYRLSDPARLPELQDVVRRRLEEAGLARARVTRDGDLLLLRIPDASVTEIADAKRLLRRQGRLDMRSTADRAAQQKFAEDGVIPEGWDSVENPSPRQSPEYAAWGERVLLRKRSALEGGRILRAEAVTQVFPGSAPDWHVTFELDPAGAKAFDATAGELYARRPSGMIAILVDGKVHSMPAVQTPAFGGSGRITGVGGEQAAKDLAAMLRSGALPVPLGEPAAERRY